MKRQKEQYIVRDIENILKRSVEQFPALALTGPRQSGKSTLLKHVFGKDYTIISFDEPLIREKAQTDPKLLLERAGEKIILDEIQYVPQILSYIKILIDEARHKRGRFIITGSQRFHLIKNLGDTLAGRIALFELLPFGITEKRSIPYLKTFLSDNFNCFMHSCLRGSFPEPNVFKDLDIDLWYSSYLQTYLERDIRTIYNIGSLREFNQFVRLLAARCSQILNISNLANEVGVTVNTVKNWISVLEASRIIYLLSPYYRNLGKRIIKRPKLYFLDVGLAAYLMGLKTEEHIEDGPFAGALFENFVIQETVKYFLNKGIEPALYFIKTHNEVEVDLVIEVRNKLYPFEIKFAKTLNSRMASSIERVKRIFAKLDIEPGYVVSFSEDKIQLSNNVSSCPIAEYFRFLNN